MEMITRIRTLDGITLHITNAPQKCDAADDQACPDVDVAFPSHDATALNFLLQHWYLVYGSFDRRRGGVGWVTIVLLNAQFKRPVRSRDRIRCSYRETLKNQKSRNENATLY